MRNSQLQNRVFANLFEDVNMFNRAIIKITSISRCWGKGKIFWKLIAEIESAALKTLEWSLIATHWLYKEFGFSHILLCYKPLACYWTESSGFLTYTMNSPDYHVDEIFYAIPPIFHSFHGITNRLLQPVIWIKENEDYTIKITIVNIPELILREIGLLPF